MQSAGIMISNRECAIAEGGIESAITVHVLAEYQTPWWRSMQETQSKLKTRCFAGGQQQFS